MRVRVRKLTGAKPEKIIKKILTNDDIKISVPCFTEGGDFSAWVAARSLCENYVLYSIFRSAGVAQSVEQLICNQQVAGSSPIASSKKIFCPMGHHGGVPERSKGADCKSAGEAYGGSNPPPSTSLLRRSSLSLEAADGDKRE